MAQHQAKDASGGQALAPQDSRVLVLVVMCVGYFLVLLDVTVVNVALPSIGSGLGSSVAGLQWVVDGYALALAALLLASGTIGDRRGHKRIVLVGLAVFGIASLGCALAPDTAVLIGTRVLQGIGAALLLPGTLAIISRTYPNSAEQARAIGIWAGVGSIALPAGPLLGGLLVQTLGWRWVFAINVPIVAVAGFVAARRIPPDRTQRGERVDVVGTVLAGLTLAALTFTVIEAGHDGFNRGQQHSPAGGWGDRDRGLWRDRRRTIRRQPISRRPASDRDHHRWTVRGQCATQPLPDSSPVIGERFLTYRAAGALA